MSSIFIQDIIVGTKLTWDWKVRDQIDTIEKLGTKLKYGVNDRDQIYSLPKKILDKFQSRIHVTHLNSNDFFSWFKFKCLLSTYILILSSFYVHKLYLYGITVKMFLSATLTTYILLLNYTCLWLIPRKA